MFDSIIAKEGQKYILVAFIAMIISILFECGFLTLITFAVTIFLLYAFRYKYIDVRVIKENEIMAPISGVVSAIDIKDFKKSIYIDVNLCDYHILRALEEGDFKVNARRGLNLSLSTFKAKELNERFKIKFTNTSLELISSMCNPSIELSKSKNLLKGEKIGVFLQGQVIVTLNSNINTNLKIGDKVVSGITLVGEKNIT